MKRKMHSKMCGDWNLKVMSLCSGCCSDDSQMASPNLKDLGVEQQPNVELVLTLALEA